MITPENRRAFLKLTALSIGGALLGKGEPPNRRNNRLDVITGQAKFCGDFAIKLLGPNDKSENKIDWLIGYEEIFKWCFQKIRHD